MPKHPPDNRARDALKKINRLWSYEIDENGCWNFVGALNTFGYGMLGFDGRKNLIAHRVFYERHVGAIPAGKWVLHSCDNRRCTNPEHLYIGTARENRLDVLHRHRRKNQLSPDSVVAIRGDPRKYGDIAAEHGVSYQVVTLIKCGRTWGHLPSEGDGRAPADQTRRCCKLSAADVLSIIKSPKTGAALSREFGVHIETIYKVKHRKTHRRIISELK